METIFATVISAGAAIIVCCINNIFQSKKLISEVKSSFEVAQAVTDTKLEELTREVRKHNNFAERMPVVENEIHHIEDDIKRLQQYHQN